MSSLSAVNKISRILGLAIIGFLGSTQAMAADDCKSPQTQAAMNKCAIKDYQIEDNRLNQSYRNLRTYLTTQEKSQLKSAQLAWISYRDKSCQFSTRNSVGGTIHNLEYNSCLSQLTALRRSELDEEIAIIKSR